jgi:hypothetical protein
MRFRTRGRVRATRIRGEAMKLFRLTALLGLAGSFGGLVFGQSTATVLGTVTDASGAVMRDVQITIVNTATGFTRSVVTNSSGNYNAPDLPIGHYDLKADAAGFKTFSKTGIVLDVAATVRVDISMQVGASTQSVTVEADAVQVQSDTSEVSSVITGTQIAQIDTNGRNPVQLATLMPGAASSLPDFNAPTALASNNNISFNGQRPQHNVWMIDGGEDYDRGSGGGMIVSPSPDALSEFKVLASNYSADFGQASGGTISIALKGGTRQFHGAAWEFNRNDAYDANNYFSNLTGAKPPELRYNAFGFNLGGPIFLPHLYDRKNSKTFFFYNQEWRRLIQGNEIYVNGIPGAEFTGNFAGAAPIHVPQTSDPAAIARFNQFGLTPGQPFPNNQIPSGLIDPNAALLLKTGIFPAANAAGNHYSSAAAVPTDLREEIVRIDHQINDKLALMGHLIWDTSNSGYATSLWSGDTYPTIGTTLGAPSYSAVVHLTDTISPSLLNEVAYNFNGNQLHLTPTGIFKQPAGYGVQSYFPAANNRDNRIPTIDLGTPYGVNYDTASWPWNNYFNSHQLRDDLSWTKGRHNVKFGGSWMGTWKHQDIFGNTNGNYGFNGQFSGNAFSDFLLGYAASYTQLDIQDAVSIYTNTFNVYAQDDWRVNNRLTLNLGMRWEGVPHAYDQNGRLSDFYPNLYNPANRPQFNSNGSLNNTGPGFQTVPGILLSSVPFYLNGVGLAGKNGIPMGLVQNSWNNFAPRVGFAYDLFGNQKTIVRGGFGMFYERIQGNDVYNMGPNPPFSFNPSTNNVYFSDPAISNVNGQKATVPTFPSSFTALAYSDYQLPTAMQYSFQVQQQLSARTVFSIGYVGDSNYHQPDVRNINPVPLNDPNRLAICGGNCGYTGAAYNANFDRLYPGFANIMMTEAATGSNYNSLQVSFNVQDWHGLMLQAAYTWSRELDYTTGDLSTVSDPYNRAYDYGPGSFNRTQIAIFSYNYDLPFFTNTSHAFAHAVLGGWSLSGITTFETGTPLNITLSYDNLGLGGGTTARPNAIGPLTYPATVNQWFSTSTFAKPAPLQFGSVGRDAVTGPGRANYNIALFKSFAIPWREGMAFELRVESYNTFNHTQFNGVATTFGNANFGQVTSVFDPRVLQIGAKFLF